MGRAHTCPFLKFSFSTMVPPPTAPLFFLMRSLAYSSVNVESESSSQEHTLTTRLIPKR